MVHNLRRGAGDRFDDRGIRFYGRPPLSKKVRSCFVLVKGEGAQGAFLFGKINLVRNPMLLTGQDPRQRVGLPGTVTLHAIFPRGKDSTPGKVDVWCKSRLEGPNQQKLQFAF